MAPPPPSHQLSLFSLRVDFSLPTLDAGCIFPRCLVAPGRVSVCSCVDVMVTLPKSPVGDKVAAVGGVVNAHGFTCRYDLFTVSGYNTVRVTVRDSRLAAPPPLSAQLRNPMHACTLAWPSSQLLALHTLLLPVWSCDVVWTSQEVIPNSPAAQAGFLPGDTYILGSMDTHFNGTWSHCYGRAHRGLFFFWGGGRGHVHGGLDLSPFLALSRSLPFSPIPQPLVYLLLRVPSPPPHCLGIIHV
jgi:hypothetical protein